MVLQVELTALWRLGKYSTPQAISLVVFIYLFVLRPQIHDPAEVVLEFLILLELKLWDSMCVRVWFLLL